jgi:hypothetical protein
MEQIRIEFPLRQGVAATLTISLKATPAQKAVAAALGIEGQELTNLIDQRLQDATFDICSALGIDYDPQAG